MDAENVSYFKSIETHARAFLTLIILSIGTVSNIDDGFIFFFIPQDQVTKMCNEPGICHKMNRNQSRIFC